MPVGVDDGGLSHSAAGSSRSSGRPSASGVVMSAPGPRVVGDWALVERR
jgi:hypothetical protein